MEVNTLDKEQLCEKIESMRISLHKLIFQYGVNDDKVLTCSKELDELICQLERHSALKAEKKCNNF